MRKKWIAALLAMIMIMASAVPALAYDAVTEPEYYTVNYVDQVKVKNAKTQAIIEYVYASYGSNDKFYKGKGECYGYAEMIRKYFGASYKQKNYKVKATTTNLYKKLKKLKPGTHVRFARNKNGSGRAHSIVLLKITKDTIWFTDGNVGPYNAVRVSKSSLSAFAASAQRNQYDKLVWAREPKGTPTPVKKPSVKVSSDRNGPETHISWRPVSKAKSYIVYRSSSKSFGYVKIGTVKNPMFIDRSNAYGTAYYKVKAVISGKKRLTSKAVSAMRRVKAPRAYLTVTDDESSDILTYELNWAPVEGAVKYNIYVFDPSSGKYKKTVVNGTSWKSSSRYYDIELFITAEGANPGSESLMEYLWY